MSKMAANLVWSFRSGGREASGIFSRNTFVDSGGRPIGFLEDETEAFLWHPVGAGIDEVLAWRERFLELCIDQPFEQVRREIFIITDPERETRIYSNRFAGELVSSWECKTVFWEHGWRGEFGPDYDELQIVKRDFTEWGITAEFYLYPVFYEPRRGAPNYRLRSTDRVCFRRSDQEADPEIELTAVSERVFADAMRDVSRAVSASACFENAAWRDSRDREGEVYYWIDSKVLDILDLSEDRNTVLKEMIPRLSISDRCSLQGEHLFVQGKLFRYRINLGTASIFNVTNDQHVCIVPLRAQDPNDALKLPFEGSRYLTHILGKAFLLAADDKIGDPAIRRQLGRHPR